MRQRAGRPLIAIGLVGFLAGALLSLAAAGTLTVGRFKAVSAALSLTSTVSSYTPTPPSTPTRTATDTPRPSATATKLPTPTPTESAQALLKRAQTLLRQGSGPQAVLDLLTPVIGQLTEPDDLALAYAYLGLAEYQLGHYQLAAGHFEHLYEYQHTPDNLLLLASAYEQGGDLDRALARYLELAQWEGPGAQSARELAELQIRIITEIIGTPTPSPEPEGT